MVSPECMTCAARVTIGLSAILFPASRVKVRVAGASEGETLVVVVAITIRVAHVVRDVRHDRARDGSMGEDHYTSKEVGNHWKTPIRWGWITDALERTSHAARVTIPGGSNANAVDACRDVALNAIAAGCGVLAGEGPEAIHENRAGRIAGQTGTGSVDGFHDLSRVHPLCH